MLITIEGIDGVGKSTQVQLLAAYLKERGFSVTSLREPTGGYWGRKIRNLTKQGRTASPEEECQWFLMDRMEDVEKNIKPALDDGHIVIMDRYYYSTMAYQGALGLDVEKIRSENEKFAPKPDLVIILDVSPETGLKRITEGRKEKLNYFETLEYQRRVRKIFLSMKVLDNVKIIDAGGTQNEVSEKIRRVVEELIGPAFDG
ncbi:MAG: dTMP kinase [Thermoplasmata archaeon]|nr:MAG: dTMP kinase [Thermoplasmata archaeon]